MKKLTLIYIISTLLFLLFCHIPETKHDTPATISVYRTSTGTITVIPIEQYVQNVVACEMPSSYHIEALKAQAVACRTYAASRKTGSVNPKAHPIAPLCDTTQCQVYNDSFNHAVDWDKIKKAVCETESEMLYYNDEVISDALYHASSGGRTENSEDVFVSALPYLRSVDSPYEDTAVRNGHGVGMSQQGANGMAKAGYSYKKILSHYYSGTVVY